MPKMKIAYVISERNGKSYWNRVGVAFVNRDNSINVILEAIPVSGRLQLRDYVPKDDQPTCCHHFDPERDPFI